MTFACPGGCQQSHPLAEGQLVIEHPDRCVRKNAGGGYKNNLEMPIVVILCTPCTAKLVLDRAGLTV